MLFFFHIRFSKICDLTNKSALTNVFVKSWLRCMLHKQVNVVPKLKSTTKQKQKHSQNIGHFMVFTQGWIMKMWMTVISTEIPLPMVFLGYGFVALIGILDNIQVEVIVWALLILTITPTLVFMILASIGNTLIRQIGLMQMKVFLQNVSINMVSNYY